MTHNNGNDDDNYNDNNKSNNHVNDTNSINNSINSNTIINESRINKNSINKKRLTKYFTNFVNLLDTRSDYYILSSYMRTAKRSLTTFNTQYVAKNADHVPLPLPRDHPEKIYETIDEPLETGETGEKAKIDKKNNKNEKTVDVIKVDIDCKNACYNKNCIRSVDGNYNLPWLCMY